MVDTKGTVVIAGFPGVGKTWCFHNLFDRYNMRDTDSSNYSWLYDERREKTDIRNPEFPDNYIRSIKSDFGRVNIIFISTHEAVRRALEEEQIPYVLVFPEDTEENKIYYITKYLNRGSTVAFCENIKEHWSEYIGDMKMETWPVQYVLGSEQEPDKKDLAMVIDDIVAEYKNYMEM